ncbi:MAG: aminoacyl-tRNA hydrolase, partial [Clostridiales bacterium]|nr:aminoacyl-tRNA hydrolase [Clostridiales bacterium]
TYMNLSGEAVGQAARFYKIPPERVLVISDDVALPQGKLRIRRSGSAGGHNGLKNIIAHLGSDQFPRVKVGVGGKPHPDSDMADWVLSKFTGPDKTAMEQTIDRAADAVTCLLAQGVDKAMASFNG